MTRVFVSYASPDRERVKLVINALNTATIETFWDQDILPGESWNKTLEKELNQSDVVLVLWTASALNSAFVRSEALRGLDQRKLLQVVLDDDIQLPLGLDQYQCEWLDGWTGQSEDPRWHRILAAVWSMASPDPHDFNSPNANRAAPTIRPELEGAGQAFGALTAFLTRKDIPWPLRRNLENQRELLVRYAEALKIPSYDLVFVGDVGVGKSTAICSVFDLKAPSNNGAAGEDDLLLPQGAGRTSLCEVIISWAPDYAIEIDPYETDGVRKLIEDLGRVQWANFSNETDPPPPAPSAEVSRALRNMIGLTQRPGQPNPFKALVENSSSQAEFLESLLERMDFASRKKTQFRWTDSDQASKPMGWLKSTFGKINFGKHEAAPFPQLVNIKLPATQLLASDLNIKLVDTKGIDAVAIREDLDARLRDPRSLMVFCSGFADAPGQTTRQLIEYINQALDYTEQAGRIMIMVLPRSDEAANVVGWDGETVADAIDGVETRRQQITDDLIQLGRPEMPLVFFNALEGAPQTAAEVRKFLVEAVVSRRTIVQDRVTALSKDIETTLANHEDEALKAALAEIALRLAQYLKGNRELPSRNLQISFLALQTVSKAHAATIAAACRRAGTFGGLDIPFLVTAGAAESAIVRASSWRNGLRAFFRALEQDEALKRAFDHLERIERRIDDLFEEFAENIRADASEVFVVLRDDDDFWNKCEAEWGQGAGYRLRVAGYLDEWFSDHAHLIEQVEKKTLLAWTRYVIQPLAKLSEDDRFEDG